MTDFHLVAVYGTLKSGLSNHDLLRSARLIGQDRLNSICLYDLGCFPAATARPSGGIHVEVYAVSERTLTQLDLLEGFLPEDPAASLYVRARIATVHGQAWIYLYNQPLQGMPLIEQGSWEPGGKLLP